MMLGRTASLAVPRSEPDVVTGLAVPVRRAARPGRPRRDRQGRTARRARAAHASFGHSRAGRTPPPAGAAGATRVAELLPVRYGRMLASPLAYYRGAALPMAADLAHTPPQN